MKKHFFFPFFFALLHTYIVASRGKVVKTRVFNSLFFFLASSYNSVTLVVDCFIYTTVLKLNDRALEMVSAVQWWLVNEIMF